MPLDPISIQNQIESLIDSTKVLSQEEAKVEFAKKLTEIIISSIKSSTITLLSGVIQVQGSPSAQANITPLVIENGLS